MKANEIKAVIFEAGHGWNGDPGAVWNWTTERRHTVEIAKICWMFMPQVPEFKHIETIFVWVDENLTLLQKINRINKICKEKWLDESNSILVSIHINSWWNWKASGVEWWYYSGSKESESLCSNITKCQSEIIGITQRASRWDQTNRHWRLWIVRDTKPLACLIECWFISNIHDSNLLKNPETIQGFWRWVVRWIKRFVWITS